MPSFSHLASWAALVALATCSCAQNITIDGSVINATVDTVAPAVSDVNVDASNSSVDYFSSEAAQLTDSVLTNLTDLDLSSIDLFSFDTEDAATTRRAAASCRVMPGDAAYPCDLIWKVFGLLLGKNALIKTVPLASPCYTNWNNENATECTTITDNWSTDSYMHADDPTSVMWPLYQGRTCMPTSEADDSCTLGGYPSYAVNVSTVAQIQLAINFARNANLRLVVKNTGHDFNGKSAGAGALSIWTHNLKGKQFYKSLKQDSYVGPAVKVGTGIQAFELYAYADANNVTVVGGEGKSVGVAGGFMLGGGHSPLSSIYGMAADQLLAMEVVLPDGRFVTASNSSNADLFWALRGGGGSTFGVVTSITVKAYPRMPVAVATFSFVGGSGTNISSDTFWDAIAAYASYFPQFNDLGFYEYFQILLTGEDSYVFNMAPFFAPTRTADELATLIAPMLADFSALGVSVSALTYYSYDNFYDAWDLHFPLESVGVTYIKTASRLFPRDNFVGGNSSSTDADAKALFNATIAAIRSTVAEGATLLAFNIAASPKTGYPDNSINPAWRKTSLHAIQAITWSTDANITTIAESSLKLTNDWMQRWRDVSPDAGAYMSEADILEPDFQQAFYGDNYARLYSLKQRYDPRSLFYAPTGVGSENWYITDQVDGLPTQNGRLCPV